MRHSRDERVHNLEDLIRAVRNIPRSHDDSLTLFAASCAEVADDELQLTDDQVREIVMNFPYGCDSGREEFLADFDISPRKVGTRVRMAVTVVYGSKHEGLASAVSDFQPVAGLAGGHNVVGDDRDEVATWDFDVVERDRFREACAHIGEEWMTSRGTFLISSVSTID